MRIAFSVAICLLLCMSLFTMNTLYLSAEEDNKIKDQKNNHSFSLTITPSLQEISRSETYAKYVVTITSHEEFDEKVILSIENLPKGTIALFNPAEGRPNPIFKSNLIITVNHDITPGTYTFFVYVIYGDIVQKTSASLQIQSTVTSTSTISMTEKQFKIFIETDRLEYTTKDIVQIFGRVYFRRTQSLFIPELSVQVLNPEGEPIYNSVLKTSKGGYFSASFNLSADSLPGTYTVFATASLLGFREGFAKTVFTVGESSQPSIVIDSVYTTTVSGGEKEVFRPGETVLVWVLVNNTGADLKRGMIWVEVIDPLGIPIMVAALGSSITHMEQTKVWIQIRLNQNTASGIYEANAFVSTGYISEGGKFIAHKDGAFLVS